MWKNRGVMEVPSGQSKDGIFGKNHKFLSGKFVKDARFFKGINLKNELDEPK